MASWRSPGLGPARPLTVTLAPRAQLGTRPGLRGRREQGPGLGREGLEAAEWAMDGWLVGQLLTWETCPTSPGGRGLNTLPWAPTAPPTDSPWQAAWHHYPVRPAGLGQCPLLSVGAAHSRRSQGVSLSLGQALAGRLAARTGRLPTTTTASWTSSSGSATAPPSQAPPAAGAGALCLLLQAPPLSGLGPEGRQILPRFPLQRHPYSIFCFLLLFCPHTAVAGGTVTWSWGNSDFGLVFQSVLGGQGGPSLVQGCRGMELGLWACLWFLLSTDTGIRLLG